MDMEGLRYLLKDAWDYGYEECADDVYIKGGTFEEWFADSKEEIDELCESKTETTESSKLNLPVVSGSFSAEKLKEAYTDGFSDSRYDFDSENYR